MVEMLYFSVTVLLMAGCTLAAPVHPPNDNSTTTRAVPGTGTGTVFHCASINNTVTQMNLLANGTISPSTRLCYTGTARMTSMLSHPTDTVTRSTRLMNAGIHNSRINTTSAPMQSDEPLSSAVHEPRIGLALARSKNQSRQASSTHFQSFVDTSVCATSWPSGKPDFNTIPRSCGVSWLDTINTWRHIFHKSTLTWSPRLAQIAWNAGVNNRGGSQNGIFRHSDLRSVGSYGEVETPGYVVPTPGANLFGVTPFEGAVLAWLCEVPGPKFHRNGIDLCNKLVKHTNHINVAGQRGHHDAFLGDYKTVGCSFVFNSKKPHGPFAGAYVCDYGHY